MSLETREIYDLITRCWEKSGESELRDDWPYRIYGRADASIWAIVDEEDYRWAQQWRWGYAMSPRGKIYVQRRSGTSMLIRNGETIAYMRGGQKSIYLHREIIKRAGKIPLSEEYKIVDHQDGNSLDCRRHNLEWATIAINNTFNGKLL